MERHVRRRAVLAAGASVAMGTVAGCFGDDTDWDVAALSTADGTRRWTARIKADVSGGLALSDGTLYALGDFGAWAFAAADGSEQWRFEPESYFRNVLGAPVLAGEDLYFATGDLVQCLAAADGGKRWRIESGDGPDISAGPVRADDTVVFAFENGRVAGHGAADGKRRWERNVGDGVSAVASAGDTVLVGTNAHRVLALSVADGSERWRRSLPTGAGVSVDGPTITVSEGVAYVGGGYGDLLALGVDEGRTRWTVELSDRVRLTVDGDVAFGGYYYAPSDSGSLDSSGGAAVRFDLAEGGRTWRRTLPHEPEVAPVIGGEAAFFVTHGASGKVHALARTDGSKRWQYDPGERRLSNPVVAGDTVFVGLGI